MKKITLLLFCTILLASCATWNSIISADKNMRKLDINMTKNEVVDIMGNNYEVINRTENTFVLGYKSSDEGIYMLFFEDDLLKEWNKEWMTSKTQTTHIIKE